MNVERLFKDHPPKEPLTSLAACVSYWDEIFEAGGPKAHMRDEVVDWCAQARSFEEAVWRATNSLRPNGKLHNHQSKVLRANRDKLAKAILRDWPVLKHVVTNFDKLHDFIESRLIRGIGPVTDYDVAVRIGAYLKFEPESLYLHAGVKKGWEALYGRTKTKRIRRPDLPVELAGKSADTVEDFICTMRVVFEGWIKQP